MYLTKLSNESNLTYNAILERISLSVEYSFINYLDSYAFRQGNEWILY